MVFSNISPRKALNKAFLKSKPSRGDIEIFKKNLIKLIDQVDENESEEFHKNILSTFLRDTYYLDNHYINTKGRNDLVIHNEKKSNSTVGVIIEVKKPSNKYEMPTVTSINVKAMHELILYFFRERILQQNFEIKYLIITNLFEWFIFDASLFEKSFAQDKKMVNLFLDFNSGRLSGNTTDFFYKKIAKPAITKKFSDATFTYFDIRDYYGFVNNEDDDDDINLLSATLKTLNSEFNLQSQPQSISTI